MPAAQGPSKPVCNLAGLKQAWRALAWSSLLLTLPAAASQISLAWNDNSGNETSFEIDRALADLVYTQVATVAASVSVYTDTSVSPSTAYWYRVRANNASGDSANSNVITATAPAASNTAPAISNIANMTISVGSSTGALAFTVSDAETAAGTLLVTGASSNTALVPVGNIVFGGSGANRTVMVTPAAAQTGTTTITVTVSDGVLTAADTFVLTVNAVNTAPTISNVLDQTIAEDANTSALGFVIGDGETAASSLSVTATSSNLTLVPAAGIALGGSGANRTITVTPAANQNGTATITITVSDGQASVSDTFLLTVNPVNDGPTISDIAAQSTTVGTATPAIPFTVGDIDTALTALTVTASSSNQALVPDGSIVLAGTGANRTVSLTPVAGQSGTATITATVTDGLLSAADTFVLTVSATASGTFSNAAAITIPTTGPATPYPSVITVGGVGGTMTNVTVQLIGFNQPWSKDVDVLLVSPTGQKLLLMSDVGTGSTSNATFTFSDAAASSLPASGSLVSGTYKPTNYDTTTDAFAAPAPASPYDATLATFNGQNPNGQWSLYVMDDDSAPGNFAGGWSITLTTGASAPVGPTISDIADSATPASTSTPAIPFVVNDADTPFANLTVTATSANTTLVPNASLVLGGSGSNRTLTVTPAPGLTGSATITVNVSDGALNAADSFVLTVTAVNTPPTISNVADQAITSGGNTGALAFTVGDAETTAGLLTVAGGSSNTALVPVANIVLGGSGANRTVSVSPAAAQTGTATITVTVSDGALTAADTFVLTVNAVNQGPTISDIAAQSTTVGTAIPAIPFTVGDPDTALTALTLTASSSNQALVPAANIQLAGSGANRTISLTPVAGQTGTATITVTVSDGVLTAADTFVLTVSAATSSATFSNPAVITMPTLGAATPYPATITVGGMSGMMTNVTVQLTGFNSEWSKDVDVLLVSPTGQKLLLMSDAGWGSTTNATFTFSDAATGSLPASDSLVSGTYKPTNYDTTDAFAAPAPAGPYAITLATFNGQNPNGAWSLYVMDDDPAVGNFAGGWSITITTDASGTLPSPWLTADVGSTGATGSAAHSNGVYTVQGAGILNGTTDSLHFVYQTLSGDGEIWARVFSEQNTSTGARAGVMIRESLNSNSAHATMNIAPNGTFRFRRRSATGGTSSSTTGSIGTFPDTWVRLVRSGTTLTAYSSSDGANWTQVGSSTITMASTIYFGVAVASGSTGTLNTSEFDNVTVVP